MAAAGRQDPYRRFNFRVEIDGLQAAAFSEVSGLGGETAVVEYRVGTDRTNAVRKLPGLTRYPNIVLRRGVTQDRELWDWWDRIRSGVADRRDGSIVLQDETGADVVTWRFHSGWPVKVEGPALDATANEVAIETIEIAHERLDRA